MTHDVGQELLPTLVVAAEQVGLVVVGGSRQIDVTGGQVEGGTVLLQRIVAEDSERHVLVTVFLNLGCTGTAEGQQVVIDPQALGQRCLVLADQLLDCLRPGKDFGPQHRFVTQLGVDVAGDIEQLEA